MNEPDRTRRPPPPFRRLAVSRTELLSPHMMRVTFGGPELAGLEIDEPAASVRLLLPTPGHGDLVVPTWDRNQFVLPDGERPIIRTFTPRRFDPARLELVLDVVLHAHGVASRWAAGAGPGDEAAVSGPARGHTIDTAVRAYVLVGDETAIPAISQLLEQLPAALATTVHLEVATPDARLDLPPHPAATVRWHDQPRGAPPGNELVRAVTDADLGGEVHVWAAGEAAAMQRIRTHLFTERAIPRSRATVRGYWKHGRAGSA